MEKGSLQRGFKRKRYATTTIKKIYMFLANPTFLFCAYILYNTSS